jgi:hypothetical protein
MSQMAYDLRRLIRKGLLERLTRSNRYRLTELGRRIVVFCARLYNRSLCHGLRQIHPEQPPRDLGVAWRRFQRELDEFFARTQAAA